MVDVAEDVGADAVAHGCTGKGNDQACFCGSLFLKDGFVKTHTHIILIFQWLLCVSVF